MNQCLNTPEREHCAPGSANWLPGSANCQSRDGHSQIVLLILQTQLGIAFHVERHTRGVGHPEAGALRAVVIFPESVQD